MRSSGVEGRGQIAAVRVVEGAVVNLMLADGDVVDNYHERRDMHLPCDSHQPPATAHLITEAKGEGGREECGWRGREGAGG